MTVKLASSPWLALLVGVGLAVIAALILGAITLRMSGHFLPLATIAWGLALYYTMGNMEFLGKYDGLLGVPTLQPVRHGPGHRARVAWRHLAARPARGAGLQQPARFGPGRAIRAVKDGSTMAEAMGISTFRYKLVVFVLAAVLAAVSGWLFAFFQRTVNPRRSPWARASNTCSWRCWAASRTCGAPSSAAAVVKLTEDQLQVLLPKLIGTSGSFETIVFGIVLVVVLSTHRTACGPSC
jgi:branched-chain amino acid transport system permease protein